MICPMQRGQWILVLGLAMAGVALRAYSRKQSAQANAAAAGESTANAAAPIVLTESTDAASHPQKIPFSCRDIAFHRGWHFQGESTIIPSADAELAALHLTVRAPSGFRAQLLDTNVTEFDPQLQFVRADEKGAPADRFYGSTSPMNYYTYRSRRKFHEALELVVIGAVRRGTKALRLLAMDPLLESPERCEYQVTLGDAPPWPPLPRYQALKLAKRGDDLLLLYRAENVLLGERPAPDLSWKAPPGLKTKDGLAVQEIKTGEPAALVSVNENGEPVPPNPSAKVIFIVAKWPWTPDPNVPGRGIPTEYTAGDRMSALPPLSNWVVSKALDDALQEATQITEDFGDDASKFFVRGGKAAVMGAVDAGVVYALPWVLQSLDDSRR